jgi:farnesyl-diphosphate farnesyltransferase
MNPVAPVTKVIIVASHYERSTTPWLRNIESNGRSKKLDRWRMTIKRVLTREDVDDLLLETSRTFALAVPFLPLRTRRAVALAYLLFRCADTLEDAATWLLDERRAALEAFARMLDGEWCEPATVERWLARGVTRHEGYARLLRRLPDVLDDVDRLPPAAAACLRRHARRTTIGMRDLVASSAMGLQTLEALREYCYVVAGIVGELLTETFLRDAPQLESVKSELLAEQGAFGEGLQLVNILKDERDDRAEGRVFLPDGILRGDVFALAASDLRGARRYIAALQRGGAPPGFIAFTSLPCELAEKTLDALREHGPGAKVPRTSVAAMVARYYALAHASA